MNKISTLRKLPAFGRYKFHIGHSPTHISIKKMSQNAHLQTTKLNSKYFDKIYTPELKYLAEIFNKNNYEIRIAGGAIRDFLMDLEPKDIDFASTATPTEMKNMFEAEGVRLINKNGEKHGTITPRINEENFEITTLMAVALDGEERQISYTRSWEVDAERRDLTINAMYLGLDGTVYDYFNGTQDLENKKVRFVKNAEKRIKEDYLRILRYFRFYGRIAVHPDNHDPETLNVIRENAHGLAQISGERKWLELNKILVGGHTQSILEKLLDLDVLRHLGFPKQVSKEELQRVCPRALPLHPHAGTLLATLLSNREEVLELFYKLKMTKFARELCLFLLEYRDSPHDLPFFQKEVIKTKEKSPEISSFIEELLKYRGDAHNLRLFQEWVPPEFPITGTMILARGYSPRKLFMPLIFALKDLWFDSHYTLTMDDLLDSVPKILDDLEKAPSPKKLKAW